MASRDELDRGGRGQAAMRTGYPCIQSVEVGARATTPGIQETYRTTMSAYSPAEHQFGPKARHAEIKTNHSVPQLGGGKAWVLNVIIIAKKLQSLIPTPRCPLPCSDPDAIVRHSRVPKTVHSATQAHPISIATPHPIGNMRGK